MNGQETVGLKSFTKLKVIQVCIGYGVLGIEIKLTLNLAFVMKSKLSVT